MSIGETLVAARAHKGLSVEDVSASTRIRSTLVRKIEADDFTGLGGDVYARGHLRSIATFVGLDPVPLVAEFDRMHGGAPAGPPAAQIFEPESTRPERSGPNWAAAMVVALLIVIAIAAAPLVSGLFRPASKATVAADKTAGPAPAPAPTPTPSASGPAPDAVAQVPVNGVSLRIRLTGDKSWVLVTNAAKATLYQGVLNRGDLKDFQDPSQLRLTLGNAGAVDLVVNGKDLGSPGAIGEVSRSSFSPGDPTGSAG
ncbi:MAG: helix-turn-helix domain-containing protein [Actinomycetota bacterium]|nr:helix-turn-helix domain-containing protein [Actinomycetota bacterium]